MQYITSAKLVQTERKTKRNLLFLLIFRDEASLDKTEIQKNKAATKHCSLIFIEILNTNS